MYILILLLREWKSIRMTPAVQQRRVVIQKLQADILVPLNPTQSLLCLFFQKHFMARANAL